MGVLGMAWGNIRPNSIYDRVINEIEKGEPEGWKYGELKELFDEIDCDI